MMNLSQFYLPPNFKFETTTVIVTSNGPNYTLLLLGILLFLTLGLIIGGTCNHMIQSSNARERANAQEIIDEMEMEELFRQHQLRNIDVY